MNIEKEREQFIGKLDKLSSTTKEYYSRYLGQFLEWMSSEKLKLNSIRYEHLLNYVRHIKKQNSTTAYINRHLHVLQRYFTLKQKEKVVKRNPVVGLHIKGHIKKLPKDLFDRKELDQLHEKHPADNLFNKRNKVMLGLLVHQGLATGELERLRPEHIKLNEGKIHVPGRAGNAFKSKTSNARTLELKSNQVLELKEYLEHVRPTLNTTASGYLFISNRGRNIVDNVLRFMGDTIRQYEKNYKDVKQIRSSVIAEWLKEKDVRVVQYMAGHVSVISTERYKAVRLEDLQQALDQFHPLK
jgi:integrase/recombinase XerD